jgi:hypothetical protein
MGGRLAVGPPLPSLLLLLLLLLLLVPVAAIGGAAASSRARCSSCCSCRWSGMLWCLLCPWRWPCLCLC